MFSSFFSKVALFWVTVVIMNMTSTPTPAHEATIFSQKETFVDNFPVLAENMQTVGEKYGYKVKINRNAMKMSMKSEENMINICVENDGYDNTRWPERVVIVYTRDKKNDKGFDLDFLIELVNSVSYRKYTEKECEEFLFDTTYKYMVVCNEDEAQVERREFSFDSKDNYQIAYAEYKKDEFSRKREELTVTTLSNSK